MKVTDKITVTNEDNMELMARYPDNYFDLLITDPPYNTTNLEWDNKIDFDSLWKEWNRIVKEDGAFIFTASQPFTTDLINSNRENFRYELIWDKKRAAGFLNANRMPLKTHENILVFYRKLPTYNPQKTKGKKYDKTKYNGKENDKNVIGKYKTETKKNKGERFPVSILEFSQNWSRQQQVHPTQKPIDLFRYLIRTYTNKGDMILDCYGGSCVTAFASHIEGRSAVVCELDKDYYEASIKRINQHISQQRLF